ncbi:hypothetical protein [Luteibacter sp.]|jgi:gluconate 2-dehydrogenase
MSKPKVLKLENIVPGPHIAGASRDTRRDMAALAVDNVLADASRPVFPNV